MTRKIGIILIILLINFSCERDKPFEIPEGKTELAMFAEDYPEDSLEVIISLAQTMGHYPYYQINEPIKVSLFEDNILLQEKYAKIYGRKYIDTAYYGIANFDNEMLKEGNRYKIKVSNFGYDDIEAETIKPVPVKIKSLTWKLLKGKVPEWYYVSSYNNYPLPLYPSGQEEHEDTLMREFTITFDDPPGNNFYQFGIHYLHRTSNFKREVKIQYASFEWPDPLYSCAYYFRYDYVGGKKTEVCGKIAESCGKANEIVFNDKDFNGKEKTVTLVIPASEIITTPLSYIIKLYSLSEDHYRYIVSKWLYNRSKDDPFAEPVDFHSNVSNGIGIFSIASVSPKRTGRVLMVLTGNVTRPICELFNILSALLPITVTSSISRAGFRAMMIIVSSAEIISF
ncbi:hypothetical protein ES705_24398 [subsurface metagenome]